MKSRRSRSLRVCVSPFRRRFANIPPFQELHVCRGCRCIQIEKQRICVCVCVCVCVSEQGRKPGSRIVLFLRVNKRAHSAGRCRFFSMDERERIGDVDVVVSTPVLVGRRLPSPWQPLAHFLLHRKRPRVPRRRGAAWARLWPPHADQRTTSARLLASLH